MATPVEVPFDSLESGRGLDATEPSWRFPEPWPGGTWRLADIVDYMEAGALALLKQAALYRERWLRNFYRIGLRSIGGREGWPRAYVIPGAGQNPVGLPELLRILATGDVEVQRATEPFVAEGRRFAAGSYVVSMTQPYSVFAKTLLEAQEYPALRQYPGGPLRTPYDATAHTLPLLMGVEAVPLDELPAVGLTAPIEAPDYEKTAPGLSGAERPRVAIYEPWIPSMDAGWTRWIFDEYGIEYERLRDAEAQAGGLRDRFDAIVLPDMSPRAMIEGHEEGTMPPKYVGGLGAAGVRGLEEFVRAGGTLITFNRSSSLAIDEFGLPVVDVLGGLDRRDFFIPGSILRLELEPGHALAAGVPTRTMAWFERGLAFEPADEEAAKVEIVGRYGADEVLLSGWADGTEHIAGYGALAAAEHGRGKVVLFGFRPQYRGQTIATYPLMFNALKSAIGSGATD